MVEGERQQGWPVRRCDTDYWRPRSVEKIRG